jgi:hypothetical protein
VLFATTLLLSWRISAKINKIKKNKTIIFNALIIKRGRFTGQALRTIRTAIRIDIRVSAKCHPLKNRNVVIYRKKIEEKK